MQALIRRPRSGREASLAERPGLYRPTPAEVDALIAAARRHPLGLSFLRDGALDSVSAIFGTHAFVVDAARVRLARSARGGRRAA
ncbi:MAG: hypothetical protein HY554_11860 [Elusimicrobia bacterium]|nr:hypothetical protein [Elusimicrobiota bacterium]